MFGWKLLLPSLRYTSHAIKMAAEGFSDTLAHINYLVSFRHGNLKTHRFHLIPSDLLQSLRHTHVTLLVLACQEFTKAVDLHIFHVYLNSVPSKVVRSVLTFFLGSVNGEPE
jgi:hypothetical protein